MGSSGVSDDLQGRCGRGALRGWAPLLSALMTYRYQLHCSQLLLMGCCYCRDVK